jgi:hypothetical protein
VNFTYSLDGPLVLKHLTALIKSREKVRWSHLSCFFSFTWRVSTVSACCLPGGPTEETVSLWMQIRSVMTDKVSLKADRGVWKPFLCSCCGLSQGGWWALASWAGIFPDWGYCIWHLIIHNYIWKVNPGSLSLRLLCLIPVTFTPYVTQMPFSLSIGPVSTPTHFVPCRWS